MKIFALNKSPRIAAKMHSDKDLPKMILETAQTLSAAHHVYNTPQAPLVCKVANLNRPCAAWARESVDNYSLTFELFRELNNQFVSRFGKRHPYWSKLKGALSHTPNLPLRGLTPFAHKNITYGG